MNGGSKASSFIDHAELDQLQRRPYPTGVPRREGAFRPPPHSAIVDVPPTGRPHYLLLLMVSSPLDMKVPSGQFDTMPYTLKFFWYWASTHHFPTQ